ncbi:MAG: putative flavoprotein CzcO associated with the cation diffusion facilitator CzcD [Frankiales bacterium]|nr:putative flavoprotein CzcO associated with the cation diffusion facilitator CzcD [Frankiales bacterium]
MDPLPSHVRVAVIGSGFAGLGMAIRLRQHGVTDLVVLERAGSVGGTWRDNTYPGCACDVPSHLYSFSFAPNPRWSHSFSRQPEIQAYLERTAEEFGVLPHVRFHTDLQAADWDESAQLWRLRTSRGDLTAQVLVAGCGGLVEPALPAVPGVGSFEGPAFHSARWDHDAELKGKRVAVIGTGASAIQFVPHLQKSAARVTVFQRTPPWVVARYDREYLPFEKRLYARVPVLQKLARSAVYASHELQLLAFTGKGRVRALGAKQALRHLEAQVPDPELRKILTPSYGFGCKRVLISNDYLPALTQPNVSVVPHGVSEIRPHAVVAADGSEHAVEVIVYGTGFHVMDIAVGHRITGRAGATLSQEWGDRPTAHRGTTVFGFPNLFLLMGPNTALGHSSVVLMIEAQIAYVLEALKAMERRGASSIEVTASAQHAYNVDLQTRLSTTVWSQGGCKAWYTNSSGHNFALWPTHTYTFRRQTARFDPESYELLASP